MWEPNLSNSPDRKGEGTLLFKAHGLFGEKILDRLEDEVGTFALNLPQYILVAKDYIYGDIVSAHKRAVISAQNQGKELLMYIAQDQKFYKFDPESILYYGKENMKGKALMSNWNIQLGVRVNVKETN